MTVDVPALLRGTHTSCSISGKLADQFGEIETLFDKVAEVEILVRNDYQNRRVDGEVFGNRLHDFQARFEIDVRERLVEEEDIGLSGKRARDIHALHLS